MPGEEIVAEELPDPKARGVRSMSLLCKTLTGKGISLTGVPACGTILDVKKMVSALAHDVPSVPYSE